MSKKNKNKSKISNASKEESVASVAKDTTMKNTEIGKDDLKGEFKSLGLTILLIVIIFAALYYFNQKDQILDQMTDKLFGIF